MASFSASAYRGDTIRLLVTCTREGSALNLTGADLWFTMKRRITDADDADTTIQKTLGSGITVVDADEGTALVTIEPEDTDELTRDTVYQCDVQVVESSGVVTTVASGTLTVVRDVTRSS